MEHELFSFMNDPCYRLMLDMSREGNTSDELEEIKGRFRKQDRNQLFDICHEHELHGVVGRRALSLGLELGEKWKQEYEKQKSHLEFLKAKAMEVCSILADNGIPMVILKNGGIMISIMDDAVQCPMEDIDSLVRKKDFYKAHEILVKHGFVFKFRSEFEREKLDEAYRNGSTEYKFTMPDGNLMWFELAWRSVAGRWIRPDLEPDTDEFMARSIVPAGTDVHVLSPEDNLLQVCIHTAKHSYVRAPGLRLHMDVDRIVTHCKIDWDVFLERVRKTHVRTSTYLSLFIPSVIFRTKVPQSALDELKTEKTNKLLDLLSIVGLPHPMERKFNKWEFLRFQTELYDSFDDVYRVLIPSRNYLHETYNYKSSILTPFYLLLRGLDLVGIRKRK